MGNQLEKRDEIATVVAKGDESGALSSGSGKAPAMPVRRKHKEVGPGDLKPQEIAFMKAISSKKFSGSLEQAALEAGYGEKIAKSAKKRILYPIVRKNPDLVWSKLKQLGYTQSQYAAILAEAVCNLPPEAIQQRTPYEEALDRAALQIYEKPGVDIAAEAHLEALKAKRPIKTKSGKMKLIPDHPTRMAAVYTFLKATANLAPARVDIRGKILHGHLIIPTKLQEALRAQTERMCGRFQQGTTLEDILSSDDDIIDVEAVEVE